MARIGHTVAGVIEIILGLLLIIYITKRTNNTSQPLEVVRYDTLVVVQHDTIRSTRTILQETYKYDTIMLRDTVYIADIPQNYVDSTTDCRLEVNAVKMYDYSISIYKTDTFTRYVPQVSTERTETSRRGFGQSIVVGLQVGYGLGVQPATMQARFEPYVGVGITYGWGYHW